jgi:type IV pilus assembly protein PilE
MSAHGSPLEMEFRLVRSWSACRRVPSRNDRRLPRGFTLVELMIVVAIVSILVMVALPSYQSHMRRSVRAEAQAYLMEVAAKQQQFLVDTRAYAATLAAVAVPMPARVGAAYSAAMPDPGAVPPTFTVTLTPSGSQADDRCGALSIDQTGNKTAAVTGCW